MTAFVAVALLAAMCWIMRVLLIVVLPAERLPRWVQEALDYLAPAALAALVGSELVAVLRDADMVQAAVLLGAMVLAGLLVRRTGSLAIAVMTGAVAVVVVDVLMA